MLWDDTDKQRGKIKYPERRLQIIDWSGIRYRKITCSDIDGGFDIHGDVFVFTDIKMETALFENGERYFYEALIDNLNKPAIVIIARHNIIDTKKEIPAHNCWVEMAYVGKNKGWQKPKDYIELKDAIDEFLKSKGFENYIE